MPEVPESVDILIVGAGLAGATTAHSLRRLDKTKSVVLIEKEAAPGLHSSGRNACILRQTLFHEQLQPLADEGAGALRRGDLTGFRPNGSFLLGRDGVEDASGVCPWATGKGVFHAGDGILDVGRLLETYLAEESVFCDVTLQEWHGNGDGIVAKTSRGSIRCKHLVNAAGPWAGELGGLPLQPTNRHMFVSEEHPDIDPNWPLVWDDKEGYYFRPDGKTFWLSACDETPAAPGDYELVSERAQELADKLVRHQPGLPSMALARAWVGQRTFAPDRNFVIGPDPRNPRLFWVAGLGGHGVTTSPAVGRMAAEMLLGLRDNHPNPFAPGRLIP